VKKPQSIKEITLGGVQPVSRQESAEPAPARSAARSIEPRNPASRVSPTDAVRRVSGAAARTGAPLLPPPSGAIRLSGNSCEHANAELRAAQSADVNPS